MGRHDIAPAVGNFNVQYNLGSASLAVYVIRNKGYLDHVLYPEPSWSRDITMATVFAGAMAGMLSMGRLGDLLGRHRAFRITLAFCLAGSLVPAVASGSPNTVYATIAIGRFLLGIGVGGIYPLAAVMAAESTEEGESRSSSVGWAYFWQAPGQVAPYVAAALLSYLRLATPEVHAEWVPQLQFRTLLALGAIPGFILMALSWRKRGNPQAREAQSLTGSPPFVALEDPVPPPNRYTSAPGHLGDFWWTMRRQPSSMRALLGTSGTWFLYDIAFYGTEIFTPKILKDICLAGTRTEDDSCRQSFFAISLQGGIVVLLGVPGMLAALCVLGRWGCRRLNYVGFLALAANFAAMAAVAQGRPDDKQLLFGLLCGLNFLLMFGPNLGTYVLPAICFPTEIRSTCHGISAFGGKLGAVIGALLFPVVEGTSLGLPGVLGLQALLCSLGALLAFGLQRLAWETRSIACRNVSKQWGKGHGDDVKGRMDCSERS